MYKNEEDGAPVTHVSTTEARGGSRTRMTRTILMISLPLVVILFAILLGVGFFNTAKTGADDVNNGNAVQAATS